MTEPRPVEITYRGRSYTGEWRIEGAMLHLSSSLGSMTGPAVRLRSITPPSEIAKRMLWDLARANDPKPPFFSWR
jgi:hypothetical protein